MSERETTTVAIIGAGPAGLTLGNLLQRRGVPCIVVDKFSREQMLARARAGLLEERTVATLDRLGLSDRLHAEGHAHAGCEFRTPLSRFYVDFAGHCDGRTNFVYPQQEIVADLLDGLLAAGGDVRLATAATRIDVSGRRPVVHCEDGTTIEAEFVAGADGQHGAARAAAPAGAIRDFDMQHPFRWLTLLAHAAPSADCGIYATHERGFAAHMLRSSTVTRFHLQVPLDDALEAWPDDRIWEELRLRLAHPGWTLNEGEIFSKNLLEMRSRVAEPMQYGRVFLLGDAAHIITPCGGKGMNLAIADAVELDRMLATWEPGRDHVLAGYSQRRLPDVWRAQEFSHALLHTLHAEPDDRPDAAFGQRLQQSRMWQLEFDEDYAREFSRSYVGPPLAADEELAAPTP